MPLFRLALLYAALGLLFILISLFVELDRSTWRFCAGGLLLAFTGCAGYIGHAFRDQRPTKAGFRFALIGQSLYTGSLLIASFALASVAAQFPFEFYDYDLSGEKNVARYLYAADGAQEFIGSALAEWLVMLVLGAAVATVSAWISAKIAARRAKEPLTPNT